MKAKILFENDKYRYFQKKLDIILLLHLYWYAGFLCCFEKKKGAGILRCQPPFCVVSALYTLIDWRNNFFIYLMLFAK